jgi:hypothetical protein
MQHNVKSNALDYLYPRGTEATPPTDVTLKAPVRVGIAFAPTTHGWQDTFTEDQRRVLVDRIAAACGRTASAVCRFPRTTMTTTPSRSDSQRGHKSIAPGPRVELNALYAFHDPKSA